MNVARMLNGGVSVFAAGAGLLTFLSVGYVPVGFVTNALTAVAASCFSVGLTLGWKALDAFSVALREAQPLLKNQRDEFRRSSRQRRQAITIALLALTVLSAIAGGIAFALRDATISTTGLGRLLYFGGAAAGLAIFILFGVFQQYFSGDDLIADVRDLVAQQKAHEEEIKALAAGSGLGEQVRSQLPPRKVISLG